MASQGERQEKYLCLDFKEVFSFALDIQFCTLQESSKLIDLHALGLPFMLLSDEERFLYLALTE